jgi:hypothetical protein
MRCATIVVFVVACLLLAGGAAAMSALATALPKTYWAKGAEAVLPANAATNAAQMVSISSVSCPSHADCSAVGTYLDGSGNAQGLLLSETAGKWAAGVEAALPANVGAGGKFGVFIGSVSCASAGNCSAVGTYTDGSGHSQGLLLSEAAGTWHSGVQAALPSNAATSGTEGVSIYSVSCVSPGYCSAVGSYANNSAGADGLLLTETAGTWATGVDAALPSNAGAQHLAELNAVSCASAGDCAAVGTYVDGSDSPEGLLLTERAGAWATGVEAPLPANAVANSKVALSQVSCASAGNCSAVGEYNMGLGRDGAGSEGLLLAETAGTWKTGVEAVPPANASNGNVGPDVFLSAVSCASAGSCVAVGSYPKGSDNFQGLLLTETAGVWSKGVEATLPANATKKQDVELNSVSCASAGNCRAVGAYRTYANSANFVRHGLLLSQRVGRWGQGAEAALPANATKSPYLELSAASCPSAENCSAVGVYGGPHGSLEGMLLTSSATPPPCVVPGLKAKTLVAARRSIKSRSCSVGRIKHASSRTIKKGRVISQQPRAGRRLRHGARVNLVLSKGRR